MRAKWKVLILTIILLLTSCGQKDTGESIDPESGTAQQVNRLEFDWRISEWKSDLTDGSPRIMYLNEYRQNLEADELGDRSTVYRVWGNNLYGLDCFFQDSSDDGIQRFYYLDCYDGRTGEIWQRPVSLPEMPDYAGMEKVISAFDIVNDQELVLFIQARQDGNNQAYLAIHISMDGNMTDADVVDLQPTLQGNGVKLDGVLVFISSTRMHPPILMEPRT